MVGRWRLLLCLAAAAALLPACELCRVVPGRPQRVVQRDGQGRACWGYVRAMTCWGRCSSHEVPDWRFPFRRSYHPVCLHGSARLRTVALPHCQPGAAAGTARHMFLNAVTCHCAPCQGRLASCEGAVLRRTRHWLR